MSRKTKYINDKLLLHKDEQTQKVLCAVKKTALSYFMEGYSWNFSLRKACDEAMITSLAFKKYLENYDEIKIFTDLLRRQRDHEKRSRNYGVEITDLDIKKRLKEMDDKSDLFKKKAIQNKMKMRLMA